jgi:hypothetical protein
MEEMIASETVNAARKAAGVVDAGMKKAWSILEAAEQKKAPSEVLSPKGIQAIQGSFGSSGA